MRSFWAVTSYFNPCGWRSRLRNYRCFRRRLGVPLLTVEWHPHGRFELSADDADILVQIQGGDLLWQKERLLNLGFSRLPGDAHHVAWVDCANVFCDPGWAERTERALEAFDAVQPFSRAHYLTPRETRELIETAEPADRFARDPAVVASARLFHLEGMEALVAADLRGQASAVLPGSRLPRAPGIAWAARRSLVDELGLFDRAIIGSGDWFWMLGILGGAPRWLASARNLGYGYLAASSYPSWAEKAARLVGARVGYVDAPVLHLHHGKLDNRKYKSRHRSFSELDIDIEQDIRVTGQGSWAFVRPVLRWTDFMRSYFLERNEDEDLL